MRKRAYALTFGNNRIVTSLKRAYVVCFGNYAGQEVVMDLARFCRAVETCVAAPEIDGTKGPIDRDRTLVLEGRREVFLRITEHMHLSSEQLYALYDRKNIKPTTDDAADS